MPTTTLGKINNFSRKNRFQSSTADILISLEKNVENRSYNLNQRRRSFFDDRGVTRRDSTVQNLLKSFVLPTIIGQADNNWTKTKHTNAKKCLDPSSEATSVGNIKPRRFSCINLTSRIII